ncbi:MAG: sulfurtransferase TusA family protein [Nitrospirae bacterium]|nr:sulfurtransferase TusA family protein [Nitrospirota bacterium]
MAITETHQRDEAALKFIDEPVEADAVTDVIYMMCPMHLLTLQQRIKELSVGQVLAILTDYDGALEDIPEWCAKTGNEFIGVKESPDYFSFYVRKLKE